MMNRKLFFVTMVVLLSLAVGALAASAGLGHKSSALAALSAGLGVTGSPGAQGGATTPNRPLTAAGTAFTYQGSLNQSGSPANGSYDFTFKLYDALTSGNQVGSTVSASSVTVSNGLYSASLDFGTSAFQGDARWLEIAVRTAGGGAYTTL